MKITISLLLSFTILLAIFSNEIIYLKFKINQDEIAKTLCVLRKVKNNTCNGNCVLNAELKKIEKAEKKANNILKEKQEIVYVIINQNFSVSDYKFSNSNKIVDFTLVKNPKTISLIALRPPIC